MLIISIQSQVVSGHVGNSAAMFPMLAAGLEVAQVPTVVFSNTPDYPTLRGRAMPGDFFADLLVGVWERELPQRAGIILSGYLGSVEIARQVADFVRRAKAVNPDLIYYCDPVMGDHGPGLYVPSELAEVFRDELLPMANLASPNPFEIGWLTGLPVNTLDDLRAAHQALRMAPGARLIATGCKLADTPQGMIESVALSGQVTRHPTPYLPIYLAGTGDLFAGLIVAALGQRHSLPHAIDFAQMQVSRALHEGARLGRKEVALSDPAFRAALLSVCA